MALTKEVNNLFSKRDNKLFNRFLSFIKTYRIDSCFEKGIVVGFSGGADSVFLLLLLSEYRRRKHLSFPMVAVHVNHGIRGEEAVRDEQFCKEFCAQYNIPFKTVFTDVPSLAISSKKGLEETARLSRYRIFDEVLSEYGYGYIATAHHASDHLETVIFHMLRGSGTRGLCGIRPISSNRLHPLLHFNKGEIENFCCQKQIPYVLDSTNDSDSYARNYIRHNVVPTFKNITPDPENVILRMSENLLMDQDFLQKEAEKSLLSYPDFKIPKEALLSFHPAILSRIIPLMTKPYSDVFPTSEQILRILSCLQKAVPFSASLSGDVRFVFDGNFGFCDTMKKNVKTDFSYEISLDFLHVFEKEKFCVYLSFDKIKTENAGFQNVYKYATQIDLSSAIMNGNVTVRSKMDGDSYFYGEMTHKIKKLFNDKKVSLSLRERYPVFSDADGIFYVPGFGVRQDKKENSEGPFLFFGYDNPDYPISAKSERHG